MDADDAAIDNAIKESLREYREKIDKDWEDMFPKDIWPNAKTDRDPGGDDD